MRFFDWQLNSKFVKFLPCNRVSLREQGISSGVGLGFVVAVLGFYQFFVRLQFSVTVLKKLHRKEPFGKVDARHKAKPLSEFKWYSSSLVLACSFKNGQHKVATVAISVYQKVVPFPNSFYVQCSRIVRHSQKPLSQCVRNHYTRKVTISKVKEPVFVPGTSCCTTLSFSQFPHENLVFIVGFSNTNLTIGVCLVAPKSDCLTQVWVKQPPRGPL